MKYLPFIFASMLALSLSACAENDSMSADSANSPAPQGNTGVGQSGAQDFG